MRVSGEISNKEFLAMAQQGSFAPDKSHQKFSAVRTKVGAVTHDSKHEAKWAERLALLQQQGFIRDLKLDKRQLRYELKWNGVWIALYTADASFVAVKEFEIPTLDGALMLTAGEWYLADAKSIITRRKRDYGLIKNMMFAAHGIRILEI